MKRPTIEDKVIKALTAVGNGNTVTLANSTRLGRDQVLAALHRLYGKHLVFPYDVMTGGFVMWEPTDAGYDYVRNLS